jgi:hypothetical protein
VGWGGFVGGGEVAQTMYTHVSKCKNDKNKRKNLKVYCILKNRGKTKKLRATFLQGMR